VLIQGKLASKTKFKKKTINKKKTKCFSIFSKKKEICGKNQKQKGIKNEMNNNTMKENNK
jgi:hypothetical protein